MSKTPSFRIYDHRASLGTFDTKLVVAEGPVSETSYENDGQTVYETIFAANLLVVIPNKCE